ncbi:MAG: trypsin-like peptidase domain-containing protein [Phycisphaerales bacterium]|nr:trypsin-like peptidase domain-containing protein [Phycisphaerales bacterium]
MRKIVSYGPAIVVSATMLMALFAAPAAVRRIGFANTEASVHVAQVGLDEENILERLNTAVRSIARAVEPTVVHIAVDFRTQRGWSRRSQGSGWVYDEAGHIVTNAHVVRDAPRVVVQFFDGRSVEADIVGLDRSTDIAVLKARTDEGIFPSRRATSQQVEQGDRVFAFGSPFGFKFSMSEGIISGLGRDPNVDGGGYTNFLQSDAAVNPGNSGGPLVDIRGRVVGMNVAIATGMNPGGNASAGQSSGISFAIPLDTIESVAEQLITVGTVAKGYLGVELPTMEEENMGRLRAMGLTRGAVVTRVEPDQPAEKGGLLADDVVIEFNGRDITSTAGLRQTITVHRPGETVQMRVLRNGKPVDLNVVLGSQAESQVGAQAAQVALAEFGFVSTEQTDGGLAIGQMLSGSDAYRAGFRPGQVISKVDETPVNDYRELLQALAEKGFTNGRRLDVTVVEQGRERVLNMLYR